MGVGGAISYHLVAIGVVHNSAIGESSLDRRKRDGARSRVDEPQRSCIRAQFASRYRGNANDHDEPIKGQAARSEPHANPNELLADAA
jgi:hypothetical protein